MVVLIVDLARVELFVSRVGLDSSTRRLGERDSSPVSGKVHDGAPVAADVGEQGSDTGFMQLVRSPVLKPAPFLPMSTMSSRPQKSAKGVDTCSTPDGTSAGVFGRSVSPKAAGCLGRACSSQPMRDEGRRSSVAPSSRLGRATTDIAVVGLTEFSPMREAERGSSCAVWGRTKIIGASSSMSPISISFSIPIAWPGDTRDDARTPCTLR